MEKLDKVYKPKRKYKKELELIKVFVVARHAARNPELIPPEWNKHYNSDELGDLTAKGLEQASEMGNSLRDADAEKLGGLTLDDVFFRTTH